MGNICGAAPGAAPGTVPADAPGAAVGGALVTAPGGAPDMLGGTPTGGTPNDEPELFEAGPERVVYRAYSRPSNRTEAIQLAAEVEARLVAAGTDARGASQCWQGALRELVAREESTWKVGEMKNALRLSGNTEVDTLTDKADLLKLTQVRARPCPCLHACPCACASEM